MAGTSRANVRRERSVASVTIMRKSMASSKVGVKERVEGRLHLKAPPLFFRRDSRLDGLSRPRVPFDHGLATSHGRHGTRPEPGRAGLKWREARLDFRAAEGAAGQVWGALAVLREAGAVEELLAARRPEGKLWRLHRVAGWSRGGVDNLHADGALLLVSVQLQQWRRLPLLRRAAGLWGGARRRAELR